MHLRLISRERESTACSIASNDKPRRRLCSTLLRGVQVEPCTIDTDRLGHHKKCPYQFKRAMLRWLRKSENTPFIEAKYWGNTGRTRESGENRVMKHNISIINLNISGLPYVLLCSWKHALISLKVNALFSCKVTHLYIENRVHCMTKITG